MGYSSRQRSEGGSETLRLGGSSIVIDSPDENRQILIDYLTETGTVNPSADANWTFTDLPGEVTATFESAAAAQGAIPEAANVTFEGPSGAGFGTYRITF